MKTVVTFFFCGLCISTASAQSGFFLPDTLVQEYFQQDPTPSMLFVPSGNDNLWVNFDSDQAPGLCVANGDTPQGWYWESDLGFFNPDETDNFAFTSCSFLDLPNSQSHNHNWLIISPLFIPDTTYWLCWRSLAFQGPMYLDGYKVLVSRASNDPFSGDFTDTIFQAAQMISPVNSIGSLQLSAYNYSPGYIHANSYTNPDYFFLDETNPNAPFYRGRLEPHTVSLKDYAGQTIYLAFLHDSEDDNLIQVDDILISNNLTTGVAAPSDIRDFRIMGNPSRQNAYFSWSLQTAQETRLDIVNQNGQLMLEKTFARQQEQQFHADIRAWEPGIYYCTLQTPNGRATGRLVKI